MRYAIFHLAVSLPQINLILLSPVWISANSQPVEATYRKNNKKAKLKSHLSQIGLIVRDK